MIYGVALSICVIEQFRPQNYSLNHSNIKNTCLSELKNSIVKIVDSKLRWRGPAEYFCKSDILIALCQFSSNRFSLYYIKVVTLTQSFEGKPCVTALPLSLRAISIKKQTKTNRTTTCLELLFLFFFESYS